MHRWAGSRSSLVLALTLSAACAPRTQPVDVKAQQLAQAQGAQARARAAAELALIEAQLRARSLASEEAHKALVPIMHDHNAATQKRLDGLAVELVLGHAAVRDCKVLARLRFQDIMGEIETGRVALQSELGRPLTLGGEDWDQFKQRVDKSMTVLELRMQDTRAAIDADQAG